jgi:hypothetical protein
VFREMQKYEAALNGQFLTDPAGKQVMNYKVRRSAVNHCEAWVQSRRCVGGWVIVGVMVG